ncbi:MAG TPA: aminotransferase class III-fold pyridoxal phosphate-dependent enzyme [Syntrophomonadaceae bacterium]|nr:aminotransferase class III-fold pyridoxal phosphate-dependent enzyme [Syntrophomonadaceae bacterium]
MSSMRNDLLNPTMAKLLKTFKLDKDYVKGEGNYLYDDKGQKYLDFIAQYGAVSFGYNPEFVWEALDKVRTRSLPSFTQPSLPGEALRLANMLAKLSPGDLCYSTFCQSGAEAVETAIKLARSSTGKKNIISTIRSFHGKTMGALSATGREVYQTPFGAPIPGFSYVPFNDIEALKLMFENNKEEIAAFIVEPVQGEGGIIPAQPGYLKATQELCREYGVVFIVDEIQTGLGRSGYLFACDEEGVEPDILLLAKALGGGMLPIGVCLSSPRVYNDEFGSLHSSTFANNGVTSAVAIAVIEELLKDDRKIIKESQAKGKYLLEHAQKLKNSFPDIINEVRGKGLLVGVEFSELDDVGSFDITYITDQNGFTALLAGYLLNVHNIRLAPFLNNPMTLRLQPPLTITYEEIDLVMGVLKTVCNILESRNYAELYKYLIGDNSQPDTITDYKMATRYIKSSVIDKGEIAQEKFAFIIHYPAPEDVIANNPSFDSFTREELYKFMEWQGQNDEPGLVCHMPAIRSSSGSLGEGWLIGVPFGAKEIMGLPREQTVGVIQKAVDMGRDLGAKIVGLGALTSVVTRGGRSVQGRDIAITSGNSYTTLMAMEAVFLGAEKMHIPFPEAKGAVVGATGSIGRACALMLSEKVADITLLGNPKHPTSSKNRLNSLSTDMYVYALRRKKQGIREGLAGWFYEIIEQLEKDKSDQAKKLTNSLLDESMISNELVKTACNYIGIKPAISSSLEIEKTLLQCNMIVAASNSPEYLIYPGHLKAGSVVCDVARPADVAPEVYVERDDVLILEGGLVQYPDNISFGPNLGYRDGVSLACLSETVLLALEGDYQDYSIGAKLSLETIEYLRDIGDKHGFSLAGLVMGGNEITDADIEKIYHKAKRSLAVS